MSTNQTVRMFAPVGIGGLIQAPSGTYNVGSDGTVTVNAADVQYLQTLGFQFAVSDHRQYNTLGPPAAANATVTVASVALSAGSLTIAAQPDVPRQLAVVLFTGGAAVTAGSLVATYTANDGTTQVDTINLSGTSVSTASFTTSKGVEHLTSAVVVAPSGGTSPGIQIGTNNYLAVPIVPRSVDFAVTKETEYGSTNNPVDKAVSTNVLGTGLYAPTATLSNSAWIGIGYDFTFPG